MHRHNKENMRVLVTGIAGRIGALVARELLEAGHEIVGFDKNPPHEEFRERVEMFYDDITDRLALLRAARGCEAVVHLAALPSPGPHADETITRVNVVGTQYVLAAAEAHNIKRVVLASSGCVFGLVFAKHKFDPQYLPMDDDHPRLPQDLYGLSKLCNEETAAAYTRRCGMTTICLRITAVMRTTGELHPWFRRMFEYSNVRRSPDLWNYIEERDLARAFRLSIEATVEGHHDIIIAARDSWTPYDIRDLIHEHFPSLSQYCDLFEADSALYDTRRAEEVLGFVAQNSWRDSPEMKQMADEVLANQQRSA
jgi:nucleoside-diphosphate-sugar epimerase